MPIFKYFVPGAILFIYIYGMVTFHWRKKEKVLSPGKEGRTFRFYAGMRGQSPRESLLTKWGGGRVKRGRRGSARLRVLRHLAEVIYQNTLDIIIPPRVAVLDADQLKAVLAADLVLLAVTALDGGVVAVLAAIQLDG